MNRHKIGLALLAIIPVSLWSIFLLPDLLLTIPGFWDWRKAIIYLSGVIALWWLSVEIILASRSSWLEQKLGGLDKVFRLHRSIGIGAGILIFIHWMSEWLPKNLSKLGWLPERVRGPKGPKSWWIDLAKDVGEWTGYLLLAFVIIALLTRIPYRWFRLVHKASGFLFIAAVFHGILLLPDPYWQNPLGWLTGLLAFAGLIPAYLSVTNRIGYNRQYPARIEQVKQHPDDIIQVVCRPLKPWPGHRAGQFVFVDFMQRGEGHHPFTVASAWQASEGTLSLAIKSLGDFTSQLPKLLSPDQQIIIEGPYGRFDFGHSGVVHRSTPSAPQIWVAGGIGITPFLARLHALVDTPEMHQNIDLFYCTATETSYPDQLDALCKAAGVRLHRRITNIDGPLDPAAVKACLKPSTSVWFCGPLAWGSALAKDLREYGLPSKAFHREAFNFR